MNRTTLILTFLMSLVLLSGCDSGFMSETVDYGDLIEREGLYYKKFSDVPYTGKVTGEEQGSLKKGLREGEWVTYNENGQIGLKLTYENGKKVGGWESFHENGQLHQKGNFKEGKIEGEYVTYYDNGQLEQKGTFKDQALEGEYIEYWSNGQIKSKGNYKNGELISD